MFPFPIQGHMPPMLKLAQLLSSSSSANFFVTFVNTEYSHRRFLCHSPALHLLDHRPNFRFRTIPDGLPDDDPRPSLQFVRLQESLSTHSREAYRELLVPTGGRDPDGWPPVTCVVADAIVNVATRAAEEVAVPVIIFRTSSACSFWVFRCVSKLVDGGELPFPGTCTTHELVGMHFSHLPLNICDGCRERRFGSIDTGCRRDGQLPTAKRPPQFLQGCEIPQRSPSPDSGQTHRQCEQRESSHHEHLRRLGSSDAGSHTLVLSCNLSYRATSHSRIKLFTHK